MLGKIGSTLLVALLFFFSAYGLVHMWNHSGTFKEMDQWPRASGQLTKMEKWIDESQDSSTGRVVSKTYFVEVEYTYRVDGVSYQGDRTSRHKSGLRWGTTLDMEEDLARHLSGGGQTVSVAYHPDDPATSIAVVGDESLEGENATTGWMTIGIMALVTGLLGVFLLGSVAQFFEGGQTAAEQDYFEKLDSATEA